MRFVWGCVVAAAVFMAPNPAIGAESAAIQSKGQFAKVFGGTRPPVGFVKFCARNPNSCKPVAATIFTTRLDMTPELWDQAFTVNAGVNAEIAPVSDQELYGETERWTYPIDAGDCEDYVLLKKRRLMALGFAPEALLITVVLDEKREGHAVLTLVTKAGDFILDNRRSDILRWNDVKYTYLKRQSDGDPLAWVALSKPNPAGNIVSAGSQEE
jgi:predicted transglutaminase-like cysteine proteinase